MLRFGPELSRRTECARALEFFYGASLSLATADKSLEPSKARAGIPCMLIAGGARGPRAAAFSSLCVSGGGAATLALVEKGGEEEDLWNVISLAVAPEERNLELIREAERATLEAIAAEAGGTDFVRVLASAASSLACSEVLIPNADWDEQWLGLPSGLSCESGII